MPGVQILRKCFSGVQFGEAQVRDVITCNLESTSSVYHLHTKGPTHQRPKNAPVFDESLLMCTYQRKPTKCCHYPLKYFITKTCRPIFFTLSVQCAKFDFVCDIVKTVC